MIEYKCYLCDENIQTNDLFATISTNIENDSDIIEVLLNEKICSSCAYRFNYWRNEILQTSKKAKQNPVFMKSISRGATPSPSFNKK